MRPALLNFKAVEQPLELPVRDLLRLTRRRGGPAETAPLQTAVIQPESVVIPAQDLEFVPIAVAKDEQTGIERIEFK